MSNSDAMDRITVGSHDVMVPATTLDVGAANFCPARWSRSSNHIEILPSASRPLFQIFVMIYLLLLHLWFFLDFKKAFDWPVFVLFPFPLLVGAWFALRAMVAHAQARIRFDLGTGKMLRWGPVEFSFETGKGINFSPLFRFLAARQSFSEEVALAEVVALQLLPGSRHRSSQLNIALRDGSRRNLSCHTAGRWTRRLASELSEFLNVPLIDRM